MIPHWMKPNIGAKDWFDDLSRGLVEGAVDGVVGLGEVIYQVGQDHVGTAEALSVLILTKIPPYILTKMPPP